MTFSGGLRSHLCTAAHFFRFRDEAEMQMAQRRASSNAGLAIAMIAVYLGFVVWMYVTEPLLLAGFAGVLAIILVREYAGRVLRAIAPARLRNRSIF